MNPSSCSTAPRAPSSRRAFTLLEVLIAMALFFMAIFAILDVTTQALRAARSLERDVPDISPIAAELLLTNRLEEVEVYDQEFGELYPDFLCDWAAVEERTNGLWRVDFVVHGDLNGRPYVGPVSIYLYRPGASGPRPGLRR